MPFDWHSLYPRERWIWFEQLWTDVCMLRGRCRLPVRSGWWSRYARLGADLARNAAPLVALGKLFRPELFSARMGCQTYGVYGVDLAALCIKKRTR
jgi:hypothetical protein